jgi:release factor glutamine methyltransferase
VTVTEALREGERQLAAAGIATAGLDAETLLRHVCDWDRAQLLVAARDPLPGDRAERYRTLLAARAARRPLQHLVGTQAFWRHDFVVSPAVLIPRPETEILVQAVLDRISGRDRPRLVDVGTGSGCIAVSLAAERPDARVVAIDLSPDALRIARENARRAGVAERVTFLEGDLLAPLAAPAGVFDVVASNPPYLDLSERAALEPEVRDHDPALALFAPGDRYSLYRRLAPAAREVLVRGGLLAVEVGIGMADAVAGLCAEAGLPVEAVIPDLQAIPRVVVARKP